MIAFGFLQNAFLTKVSRGVVYLASSLTEDSINIASRNILKQQHKTREFFVLERGRLENSNFRYQTENVVSLGPVLKWYFTVSSMF